jgi:hypothetical protein
VEELVWGAVDEGPPSSYRVKVYLHDLVFFLAQGVMDWRALAFARRKVGTEFVVLHLGECPHGCCAPWHLDLRRQQENRLRSNRAKAGVRPDRASHFQYTQAPAGVEAVSEIEYRQGCGPPLQPL